MYDSNRIIMTRSKSKKYNNIELEKKVIQILSENKKIEIYLKGKLNYEFLSNFNKKGLLNLCKHTNIEISLNSNEDDIIQILLKNNFNHVINF